MTETYIQYPSNSLQQDHVANIGKLLNCAPSQKELLPELAAFAAFAAVVKRWDSEG